MDFMHYKQASLQRRVMAFMEKKQFTSGVDLISALMKDEKLFLELLTDISVPVTEMFRDPLFFLRLRNLVLPVLNTYPTIKIWIAGCATGEEAFSLAIILDEEKMLDKCIIHATDINQSALSLARMGYIRKEDLPNYQTNYQKAGGTGNLTTYIENKNGTYAITDKILKHIHFHFHNITTGSYMSGLNFILCRNLFIYFDKQLQSEITGFFMNSLRPGGFLGLGDKESIRHTQYIQYFEPINEDERIFRKRYM
jgi:chemotaxis protein methyltransferase CheR